MGTEAEADIPVPNKVNEEWLGEAERLSKGGGTSRPIDRQKSTSIFFRLVTRVVKAKRDVRLASMK